ncbi:hypothetical protein [Phaeobacter sp.]|uniref:hypothetical protein n=1 Tax=Phaeobacter sp. TaxID=1902409 RepID=UPI0025DAE912|nr:hypothetical protein [Phaeobacter sp.]
MARAQDALPGTLSGTPSVLPVLRPVAWQGDCHARGINHFVSAPVRQCIQKGAAAVSAYMDVDLAEVDLAMDVMLHIGAHRCANGHFQAFLRHHDAALARAGLAVWAGQDTRDGLLHGILPGPVAIGRRSLPQRAKGRLKLRLSAARATGADDLLICDPDLLGRRSDLLQARSLYPAAGERMARFAAAFDGAVRDVMINTRSPDRFWGSLLAAQVMAGRPLPRSETLAETPAETPAETLANTLADIAANPRSWRDVLTDLACAMPQARIWVMPHEVFADRPEVQLAQLTGKRLPRVTLADSRNQGPDLPQLRRQLAQDVGVANDLQPSDLPLGDGRWYPFDAAQTAALREAYADDLMWLEAGADGLAHLVRDPDKPLADQGPSAPAEATTPKQDNPALDNTAQDKTAAGSNPRSFDLTRGTPDDDKNRRLAGSR